MRAAPAAHDYVAFKSAPEPLTPAAESVSAPAHLLTAFWPKVIDTALSGLGLFAAMLLLNGLETVVGVKLFAPPMLASGIIIFAGPTPPSPRSFLLGTLGASGPGSWVDWGQFPDPLWCLGRVWLVPSRFVYV